MLERGAAWSRSLQDPSSLWTLVSCYWQLCIFAAVVALLPPWKGINWFRYGFVLSIRRTSCVCGPANTTSTDSTHRPQHARPSQECRHRVRLSRQTD